MIYLEDSDRLHHRGRNVKHRIYFGRDDRLDERNMAGFPIFELEADRVDDAGVVVEFGDVGPALGVCVGVVPGHKDER
jgi:hypothetical protein